MHLMVSGDVELKLYKGNITVISKKSPFTLYHSSLASFEDDDLYDQKDAGGFINLFGLPLLVDGLLRKTWQSDLEKGKGIE